MSIVEVARMAGVSSSTVSRVINNHPRVAKDTVRAVRGAMEKLKYTPSDRRPGPKPGMRGGLSGATIGFLVFGTARDRTTPAFEELMRGVSAGASRYNLKLVYHHVLDMGNVPSQVIDGPFEGILVHGTLPSSATKERLRRYPTVWLMGNRRRPDWGDQVMPDAYEVGDKAARYLLGLGHKSLAFLNLDLGHWPFRVASQSFMANAQEQGVHVELIERARNNDERAYWPQFAAVAANEVVQQFLSLKNRPTGLFVADDMQVALIQPALQRAGVEIGPGHTEIISCNNERPYLIGLSPRPAEIDIRVESIGMRGVERLIWRLNNRSLPERIVTAIEPIVFGHDGKPIDWVDGDEG